MKIEQDDFEAWLANPVTEEVLRHVAAIAEQAKEEWVRVSWGSGNPDPLLLADLRAKAQIAGDLANFTYEDLNEQSERNSADRVQSADPPQGG